MEQRGASEPRPRTDGAVRELTVRALGLGLVLSVVMASANVYLGLYAGMTVSASIPAAVVGMLLLRSLFRGGTVLETNLVQTSASAGESLAAGIIFTVPALVMVGAWEGFLQPRSLLGTTAIAFAGGLLGILFMIPMRRVFVEDPELPYPEGVACAAVLRAGERAEAGEGGGEARAILRGGLLGGAFKLLGGWMGLLHGTLERAFGLGGSRVLFLGGDVSPALVGVGAIVGLQVSVLIFLGGAVGWLLLMPLLPEVGRILTAMGMALPPTELPAEPLPRAWALWSEQIRYVGVGAMAVGGVAAIWKVRGGLGRAVAQLSGRRDRLGAEAGSRVPRTERDLSGRTILLWSAVAVAVVLGVYVSFTEHVGVALLSTVVMLAMSFFFVAVASYIVGLVGNSNSPVSGMTITALLFTGAMLLVAGYEGLEGMVAALGVAAIVCCAACTSGDVCNDLKTGALVGATPRSQQIAQIAGVAVAALVMAPTLALLHEAYGIGSKALPAPQAGLFAALVRGFFGDGQLPWGLVGLGALLGLLALLADAVLARRGSAFRLHLMPIAVGIYLPFGLSVPILAGGLLSWWARRGAADPDAVQHRGVLFASGVIAGESLLGVAVAALTVGGLGGPLLHLPEAASVGLTTVAALGVLLAFRMAMRTGEARHPSEGDR